VGSETATATQTNPRAISDGVIAAIVRRREYLVAQGLDAGPLTLQWHLAQAGLPVRSTSTIPRTCTTTG
jgi:hypothetical protein